MGWGVAFGRHASSRPAVLLQCFRLSLGSTSSRPLTCFSPQDTARAQRIAGMRAYSAFDPIQEFELESAELFAALLLGECC